MRESQFVGSVLDAVIFYGADLSASSFEKSWIFECDIIDCQLNGANFSNLIDEPSIYVRIDGKRTVLIGRDAIGYLAFNGAKVDDIDEYFIFKYHPKFQIVMKICEKLVEQKNRQEIGLVQKGAARKDTDLASDFVAMLMRRGLTKYDRTMIAITPEGRKVLPSFVEHQKMPPDIAEFLRSH